MKMRKVFKAKKMLRNLETRATQKAIDTYLFIKRDHSGSTWIEYALVIAVVCVIGALVIAGLYTLFKDSIMPTISDKSSSMFSYGG